MNKLMTNLWAVLCLCFSSSILFSQNVDINSTGGTTFATYATLNQAFSAINAGTHTGSITVTIQNSTSEGNTSATLNASGSGSASYTKVYVKPGASPVTVSGNPSSGAAVIRFSGSDNVTINGTVNGGNGGTRDLTITSTSNSTNTGVVWIRSSGINQGCTNDTIMNCNITGGSNSVTSVFGIIAGGTTLNTMSAGGDNDNLAIRNNQFSTCYYGIWARGVNSGSNNGLLIENNTIGTNTSGTHVKFTGIDLQYADAAIVRGNEIMNQKLGTAVNVAGITIGSGSDGVIVEKNRIHGQSNTTANGAYGVNITGGLDHEVINNFIYDIQTINNSLTSTTANAFGIRITTGNGHKVYFNTVHLYGNLTQGNNPGMAACLVINSNSLTGLDIRNNIFQNKTISSEAGSKMYAIFVATGFVFGSSTINRNAYMVPPVATANVSFFVGRINGADVADLTALQTATSQDANSVPVMNGLAPFLANDDYHINPAVNNPLESGGVNIAGTTTDLEGNIRQGNVGYVQNPAGTAPDIGADEFAQTPGSGSGPAITAINPSVPTNNCVAMAHTVAATVTDPNGVSSVTIELYADGVLQTPIPMNNIGGNNYSGSIPASGSSVIYYRIKATDNNSNSSYSIYYTYQDNFLALNGGPNQTICTGGSTSITALLTYPANIKITEITQDRTGAGQTSSYPGYVIGDDFVEISNLGNVAVDMSDMKLEVRGGTTRDYTFPAGVVLPASSVLVVHIGAGTDSPANRFYNTGGASNDISSGEATGYILRRTANGPVIDAVATDGFSFDQVGDMTIADWAGNLGSSAGKAGVSRNNSDDNSINDWDISDSPNPVQTLGTMNAGLTASVNYIFSWTPGGMTTSTINVSPGSTTTYTANISNGFCNASDQVQVSVIPIPTAPTVLGDTICGFGQVVLTAAGADTLKWYDASSGGNLVNTGITYNVTVGTTDTFFVASSIGSCSSPRVPVIATVTPGPAVNFTPSQTSACVNEASINLSGTGSPSGGSFSGPGVSGSQFNPGTAGVGSHYVVYTYTDQNNCSGADSVLFTVSGCLSTETEEISVKIYPNPASDICRVEFSQPLEGEIQLVLTDMTGRKVMQMQQSAYGITSFPVDISGLAAGTYVLSVIADGFSGTYRVMKSYI